MAKVSRSARKGQVPVRASTKQPQGEQVVITERELRNRVSINMRRLREEAGLTQDEAAERAGIALRLWQKVEAGESNATLATLTNVANGLDVSPEVLTAPIQAKRRG